MHAAASQHITRATNYHHHGGDNAAEYDVLPFVLF